MAEAETQSTDQCKALTESGERCSREAGDDGFCHQHDESDPIADEVEEEDEAAGDESSGDEAADVEAAEDEAADDGTDVNDSSRSETAESSESEEETVSETETTDTSDVDTSDVDTDESGIEAVLSVRRTVESTAGELIGRPLDSVTEINPTEDGWRGVVEVVERSSIPDTQDIMGRYEIDLSEDAVVQGYRRMDRYRRDDTSNRE